MALSLALIPFAEYAGPAVRGFLRALPLKSEFAALTQIPSTVMIVAVAAAVWLVDFRRKAAVFYLAAALGLSGLVVEPLKQIAGRARPEAGVLMTPDYQSRLARLSLRNVAVLAPDRAAGRDLWLFLSLDRPFFTDAYASFPSGHATSAFILAAFLCAL